MTAIRTLIATSLVSSLPIGTVFAQTDQTFTAPDALSTEKALNTTAVGQTKPSTRDASPTSAAPIERPTPEQVSDDAIAATVCVGCGTAPAAADALALRIRPSGEPERRDDQSDAHVGQRESASPAAAAKRQSDLDTVALASAHRERAESVQERTTGLWQSWLVSVCDGCGDQKPAKALRVEDWPDRDGPAATGSVAHKPPPVAERQDAKPGAARRRGSLEADLSPENVDSIRRMPQR
ncbi:hypothetical protein MKK75_20765 [Methylobacterium sp. J-030]|uniref:hypothetical protein n=1 Tax=Methylobacterium sp. J-030 TaxID=2836627 RepID=UPI001FBB6EAC|nr:hypothetical protein [Methylobacterium sp. J-030]MCJ2071196.1 hypothetical protein [Methylobacterium sp. J-030]